MVGPPLNVQTNHRGASAVEGSDVSDPLRGGGGLVRHGGFDGGSGEGDIVFGECVVECYGGRRRRRMKHVCLFIRFVLYLLLVYGIMELHLYIEDACVHMKLMCTTSYA